MRLPFGKVPVWATNGKLLAFGSADGFSLKLFDNAGALVRIVRWNAERKHVDREALQRFRSEHAAWLSDHPDARESTPEADYFPVPELMPAYAAVLLDDEGNLWVRRYPGDARFQTASHAQDWWVFDRAGTWLGSIRTPADFRVFGISHAYVMGVFHGEDDVESVRLYRIAKPG